MNEQHCFVIYIYILYMVVGVRIYLYLYLHTYYSMYTLDMYAGDVYKIYSR